MKIVGELPEFSHFLTAAMPKYVFSCLVLAGR